MQGVAPKQRDEMVTIYAVVGNVDYVGSQRTELGFLSGLDFVVSRPRSRRRKSRVFFQ